jgi:hypothetical protein
LQEALDMTVKREIYASAGFRTLTVQAVARHFWLFCPCLPLVLGGPFCMNCFTAGRLNQWFSTFFFFLLLAHL